MVRTQTDFNHADTDACSCQRRHELRFKSVMIRTVDTDVIVLAVVHLKGLPNSEQLWIAFGTGNDFRYIPSMRFPLHYDVLRWPKDCCSFMYSLAAA